jgi:hypothetical protein
VYVVAQVELSAQFERNLSCSSHKRLFPGAFPMDLIGLTGTLLP